MIKPQHLLLLLCLLQPMSLSSLSIVYNLRIAEATKRNALETKYKRPWITAITPFAQFRKTYNHTNQVIGGGLATMMYSHKNISLRGDAAVGHVSEKNKCEGIHDSRTQTDDILISASYTHTFNRRARATLTSLAGFPTHKDHNLQGIQFGTGHYALGLQADASYMYSQHYHHILLAAVRYIRFFPRHTSVVINGEVDTFRFNIGNLVDLFIAHSSSFNTHRFEIGYNPTFGFGATICPSLPEAIEQTNFIRNSFYASYRYGFLIRHVASAVTLGLSYGFDSKPKTVGDKNIVTGWATWGINY